MIEGSRRIGLFDADELALIKADAVIQQMIKDGRITLNYEEHDCGEVWVADGDGEAFKKATEIAI